MSSLTQSMAPYGKAKTNAMEIKFDKRFSRGFNLNVGYTRLAARDATVYLNEFDPNPTWQPSGGASVPHRFVATGIYELPFGKGRAFARSGIWNMLVGYDGALPWYVVPGLVAAALGLLTGLYFAVRERDSNRANFYWLSTKPETLAWEKSW
jgi:hypothetical protein